MLDMKNQKILLVFGNEINGVSQNLINKCDYSLEIPQWGTKHSLNISVTTGIILWMIKMKKTFKKQNRSIITIFNFKAEHKWFSTFQENLSTNNTTYYVYCRNRE